MAVRVVRTPLAVALAGHLGLSALAAITGCGAAATNTPANAPTKTDVVDLDATRPADPAKMVDPAKPTQPEGAAGARVKGEEGTMGDPTSKDPHVARAAALRDAAEYGLTGLLNMSDSEIAGILNSVAAGGTGVGGLSSLAKLGSSGGGG